MKLLNGLDYQKVWKLKEEIKIEEYNLNQYIYREGKRKENKNEFKIYMIKEGTV